MKKRLALWGVALFLASIATAASFRMPVTYVNRDPNSMAKFFGVSPDEYNKLHRAAGQFSSDVRHHRDINPDDLKLIIEAAEKGGPIAGEVYISLVPIKVAKYRTIFTPLAVKSMSAKDDQEAYEAMLLLKFWGNTEWRALAQSRNWKTPMYKEFISEQW